MPYLLDTNVFIESRRRWYGFDFAPGFWDWLDDAHARGVIYSIEKVKGEVLAGDDELVDWVKDRPTMFLRPDDQVVSKLREVGQWAEGAHYTQAAVNEFLDAADSYLVAHAHAKGETIVVTHERPNNSPNTVKIPEACDAFHVAYLDTFQMLRAEGVRLVL